MNTIFSSEWLIQAKQIFVAFVMAIGQLFFSHGLSSEPTLACKVTNITPDSVFFKTEVENAHNELMDDFLLSGLPLQMQISARLVEKDSGTMIGERTWTHEIQYDLFEKRFESYRFHDREHAVSATADSCWQHFLAVPRIGFEVSDYRNRSFTLHLTASLLPVRVEPMEREFHTAMFWKNRPARGCSETVVMHFLDLKRVGPRRQS